MTTRTLTRGEVSLIRRLTDEANRIATLTLHIREAKRCRNLLIEKAKRAGFTVREIGQVAKISNVRVSQIHEPPL